VLSLIEKIADRKLVEVINDIESKTPSVITAV
jgi:hypothetical protein